MFLTRLRNLALALAACLVAALAGVLAFQSLQAAAPDPQQGPRPQPAPKPAERPKATPADVAAAVEGNTAFALDLYGRLRGKEGNLFVSPYSISTALAMAYAGARGETAAQMAKTLHFTLGQERLHPALAELAGRLKGGKKRGYELKVANALWGQKGHGFLPEFLELNRGLYGAGLREVDFVGAGEEARKSINAWVQKETEGKIKDLLQPDDLGRATRLVLTNAIYFKSAWEYPFEKTWTREQPFRVSATRKVNVPMMTQTGLFRFFEDGKLKAVELPYKGKELSFVAFLPKKADGLPELEAQLTPANLKQWLGRLERSGVLVSLPRFEITDTVRLKDVLSEMGMSLAFNAGMADFSGMDGEKGLFLQAAVHKAFVRVDERGTEAAAATAVGGAGGLPPMFIADHPFLFLIRDNRSGSVLLLGRVVEPRTK
jgi:serpin B